MTKLAILSNINIDPVKSFLNKDNRFEIYEAGYNQWHADLINPGSALYSFEPDFVFVYLDATELNNQVSDLFSAVEIYSKPFPTVQFIISNLSFPPYQIQTYIQNSYQIQVKLNIGLMEFQKKSTGFFIFDFNRLISLHGYNQLFNDKFWYLGRIKLSNAGFRIMAAELINVINCLEGKTKKVLVVDLDNTLWGGIVGEDGWNHLIVSEEGTGRIYSDFQKNLVKLSETGVILAIASKNNENDVIEAFEKNNNFKIALKQFVAKKINWQNKADNIAEIAKELNVGINSTVFIDDNKLERELVKEALPEVVVPEFPHDITTLNYWFINEVVYPWFGKKTLTSEDSSKTEQYSRNNEREKESKLFSYKEFLDNLKIKLNIEKANESSIPRISQLTQKTNQFNLSVKRYSELEITEMSKAPNYLVLSLIYEDKFGNEGITGVSIIKIDEKAATLDSFLLSCRILGRKVEFGFMDYIISELKDLNIKTLSALYTKTEKNGQVQKFLSNFGFFTSNNEKYQIKIQ